MLPASGELSFWVYDVCTANTLAKTLDQLFLELLREYDIGASIDCVHVLADARYPR